MLVGTALTVIIPEGNADTFRNKDMSRYCFVPISYSPNLDFILLCDFSSYHDFRLKFARLNCISGVSTLYLSRLEKAHTDHHQEVATEARHSGHHHEAHHFDDPHSLIGITLVSLSACPVF